MGKAHIISHDGNGLYTVELQYALDSISERIAAIDERITALEAKIADMDPGIQRRIFELYLSAAEKEKAKYQNVLDNYTAAQTQAWCADLTTELSGDVATIEITRDIDNGINLFPGYVSAAYDQERDGQMTPLLGQTPSATYYNLAMLPGTQKWKPTYRVAEITSMDYAANTCDVTLLDYRSSQQSLPINQTDALINVPISYMSCDSGAFRVGDIVLLRFSEYNWAQGEVIGFREKPKPCMSFVLVVSSQSEQEAFAWDLTTNSILVSKKPLAQVISDLAGLGYAGHVLLATDNSITEHMYDWLNTCHNGSLDLPTMCYGMATDSLGEYPDTHLSIFFPYQESEEYGTFYKYTYQFMERENEDPPALGPYLIKISGVQDIANLYPMIGLTESGCPAEIYEGGEWAARTQVDRAKIYFHSIFDYDLTDTQANHSNMETTATKIFDEWEDCDWSCHDGSTVEFGIDPYDFINVWSLDSEQYKGPLPSIAGAWLHFGYVQSGKDSVIVEGAAMLGDAVEYDGTPVYGGTLNREFRTWLHRPNTLTATEQTLLDLVNDERDAEGAAPLVVNPCLQEAAQVQAQYMADNNTVTHNGAGGSTAENRILAADYLLHRKPIQSAAYGENVAGVDLGQEVDCVVTLADEPIYEDENGCSLATVVAAWMASDGHRNNLLSITHDYDETGMAAAVGSDGRTYICQTFGRRDDTWPGFGAVDMTDLIDYMDTNFNWTGDGDQNRVPKTFII